MTERRDEIGEALARFRKKLLRGYYRRKVKKCGLLMRMR